MRLFILLLTVTTIGCGESPKEFLKLHDYHQQSAIYQRNEPIVIAGKSSPNATIRATLGEEEMEANAGETGDFTLAFPPLEATTGLTLEVKTVDTTVLLNDIAIGDVWFASGQSNMEWPLSKTDNSPEVIAGSNFPNLRFFDTPKDLEFTPIDSLREQGHWIKGDDDAIADISGVAYFFARKIHEETYVPIGVVVSSWGGTGIETWMSHEAIQEFDYLVEHREPLAQMDKSVGEMEKENMALMTSFKEEIFRKGIGLEEQWYLPQDDLADWQEIKVPGYWEDQIAEFEDFDGAMWYRRTFDLVPALQTGDIRMWLSQMDDHNQVWVNGEFVGETFHKDSWTNYLVPQEVLKAQGNVIVIRIFDIGGKGGTTGLENYFDYYLEGDNSIRGRLNGTWLMKPGVTFEDEEDSNLEFARIKPNDYPSLLFNGMVSPYKGIPFKGVIWYQGEHNKTNAYQYRELFPAMIQDWRNFFENASLPFYFTQIANFGAISETPEESGGAELREAQHMTLSVPNTGMACTIDIGDADDIHPTNKKDVGLRLARHALKNEYKFDELLTDGPMYESHQIKEDKIILSFRSANGLHTVDGNHPTGFAIASENGEFIWADAIIKDDQVVLSNSSVEKPMHVRYAWAEAPAVNLVNAEGLPAYPFRTDDRVGISCCPDE